MQWIKLKRKKGPTIILTFNCWVKNKESTKRKGTSEKCLKLLDREKRRVSQEKWRRPTPWNAATKLSKMRPLQCPMDLATFQQVLWMEVILEWFNA